MNTTERHIDRLALERDAERLAPLVRRGFERIGGPSDATLQAIREEAARRARRNRALYRFRPWHRSAAAAAALVALAGTALQTHLAREAGRHAQAVSLLVTLGSPQAGADAAADTAELASRLLTVQGLDEAFLTSEAAESLWL